MVISFAACDNNASTSSDSKSQMELCEQIAKSLSTNEIDKAVTKSSELVKPLSQEEKTTVMDALVDRINNRMKTFSKSFGSTESLISEDILEEVEKYKKIALNLGVTSSDNTNVLDYLNQVSQLKAYSKYNDYWAFYNAALDDWNKANQYWEYATDSYSDYMITQHLNKSLNYFNQCINQTYNYSSSSFGILETRKFLQLYVDKINYYLNTGYDLQIDYDIVNKFEAVNDEYLEKGREFTNKVASFPTAVYYD